MAQIPKRVVWAVRQLDVQPGDHVLEIGCGDGSALGLVLAQSRENRATGVDRSALAIRGATKRNRAAVESGQLRLVESELADLHLDEQFATVFALNVNVFWLRPRKELAVLRRLMEPDGRLLLMFEPPSGDHIAQIAEQCRRNLEANGFRVDVERRARLPASEALLIEARPVA